MPIFVDYNVSPKAFDKTPAGSLVVRTMFYTIQGEGPFAGEPAVFLRLGGCNLGAKGVLAAGCEFCDTDFRLSRSTPMTYVQVLEQAWKLVRHGRDASGDEKNYEVWANPLLVVTGGEPMLQRNLAAFCQFAGITSNTTPPWRIQIETNGMYDLPIPQRYIGDQPAITIVVSPKAGGADHYPKPRDSVLAKAACLKFVLSADPDSWPYDCVPNWALQAGRPIYVSPMAVYKRAMTPAEGEAASAWDDTLIDREATAANYHYAAEYAARHGFRLTIQMQLFASVA